jgi:retron-type reverse transcriptase
LIYAPCFRDRVVHHAIIAHVGPVLDRALSFDSYACRAGKGTLAAVRRASEHAGRRAWHAQIDIRSYFASIDHGLLLGLLERRLKNRGLLGLLARIIGAYETSPGRGLPIGALTSQHFANFFLAGADRLLLEVCHVRGFVRYMDDLVWWADDRASARAALDTVRRYLADNLKLAVKHPVRVGRCRDGLNFCGYRILPGRLLLSRRRRRRYVALRQSGERNWLHGRIDGPGLQSTYAAAFALTAHGDARQWRSEQLKRCPLEPALESL